MFLRLFFSWNKSLRFAFPLRASDLRFSPQQLKQVPLHCLDFVFLLRTSAIGTSSIAFGLASVRLIENVGINPFVFSPQQSEQVPLPSAYRKRSLSEIVQALGIDVRHPRRLYRRVVGGTFYGHGERTAGGSIEIGAVAVHVEIAMAAVAESCRAAFE